LIPLSAIILPFIQFYSIAGSLYVMYCGIMDSGLITPSVIDKSYIENINVDEYLKRKEAEKT
jgi:hypothetical protein